MRVRWAISLEETMTSPSFQNTFRKAILCASESDVDQQKQFRFKEDALACLIGRLMPRKAAVNHTSKSWSSLEFVRNEKGKPSLVNSSNFEYNVSHHGDLVVLATGESRIGSSKTKMYRLETENRVSGIDVMRVNEARRDTAAEQMDTLNRHFSEEEIESVKGGDKSEEKRWHAFYRIWCLKESILKATGVGLPDGLHNHTFQIDPNYDHKPGKEIPLYLYSIYHKVPLPGNTTTSSLYFHRSTPQPQWIFEESFIGEKHCVSVASEQQTSSEEHFTPFEMTSLEEILEDADFINITADADEELDVFMDKPNKPF
ncbi:hypothetical protein CAEBREN_19836 [Caenorhabditis brenneri]|uniref:L-aminoadipate-semialdehyde dehydrogenase-phosphopantetheinyl transferase n=1 Tax=Caenorhabditis brenneri TaxID=135651 RepID=G0PGH6_CAEBE|nr:hypothetical protein CAEBREN_19836 [Caenorhabditis brenneri]